jgi:ArsR family transcriptional regulator
MGDKLVPAEQVEDAAQRFKLLSEPVRLELLNQLEKNGEMTVSELVDATGHRQANVSKHLGLMARQNILERRKEGLYAYYRIEDPTLSAVCLLVSEQLRREPNGVEEEA